MKMRNGWLKILFFFLLFSQFLYLPLSAQTIDELNNQIDKYKTNGNKIELANAYNKLGNLYWQKNKYSDAITSYEKSLTLNEELGNINAQRIICGYLGLINLEKEDYSNAVKYFELSLALNQKAGKTQEIISDLYNIAQAYQYQGKLNESNSFAQKALDKSNETNNLESIKSCNLLLAENYDKLGNSKKSSEYYSVYNSITSHLQKQQVANLENQNRQIQSKVYSKELELESVKDTLLQVSREMKLQQELSQMKFKAQEQERLAEDKEHKAKENLNRTRIRFLIVVIALALALLSLLFIQSRLRKAINKKLKEQNLKIEQQKDEIEKQRDLADKQRKNLTDSIQYARRIQAAVIPRPETLHTHFSDSFILYRPRDIVSGDFYWFAQKDNLFIIAAADCTGHGVPGAFMSMLGVAFLNEIVNKIAINVHIQSLSADEILGELREKVISSLHQSENPQEPKDGMDIALCIIDFERKKLQFSGAFNSLIIVRKGEIIHLKGDKMPVSYHQRREVPFSRKDIELQENDCLYMYSDGIIDQFGGELRSKYLLSRFTNHLMEIYHKPMQEQKLYLENSFDEWKGENNQVDDLLVIGFRFVRESISGVTDWHDRTILIAEDTDINYFLLAEVLKKTKAKLIRVKDGAEAVELVKANEIHLVLMDINMPKMDGYIATRLIKEHNSKIPVIIQTAIYEDGKAKAIEVGADDFISKPIHLKLFMEKISRFLN